MSRPKRGVTLVNLLQVDHYFYQALKDNRLYTQKAFQDFSTYLAAKEAYHKLPALNWKNDENKKQTQLIRLQALQAWIDQYITADKWQRCLMTLRQKKSRKKLKLQRLDLPLSTYLTVKALAEKQGTTISTAIMKLAKPALDKIYKAELKLIKIK